MSEKSMPTRPFCLDYADAKEDIISSINDIMAKRGIPLSIMADMLEKTLGIIKNAVEDEKQNAIVMYNRQLKEFNDEMEINK